MIDDLLFKGLKHESLFKDVPINALDCGLYVFNKNGVSYIMERHECLEGNGGVDVYYNIVASMRNKNVYESYKKDLETKRRIFE